MDKGGENFMQHETVIVLDFGGQYNQLIARRVRENNVYCETVSYTHLSLNMAKTYTLNVAGLTRELTICKVDDHLDIAAFIMLGDAELTVAARCV